MSDREEDDTAAFDGDKLQFYNQKILILINPNSGKGRSEIIYEMFVLPHLKSHNVEYETFVTRLDAQVGDFLAKLTTEKLLSFNRILILSGDGLVHEIVNALMKRQDSQTAMAIPLCVVPTGSGNGLAHSLLHMSCHGKDVTNDPDEAIRICCSQVTQKKTIQADLVKITYGHGSDQTTLYSLLSIGWGLMADIDVNSDWLRRIGEFRFTIYGLLSAITSRSYRGKLSYWPRQTSSHEDKSSDLSTSKGLEFVSIEDKFACLYAVNMSHISRTGNFSPNSQLDDHIMYLTYIRGTLTPCKVIEFLLAIDDGSHEKLNYVSVVPVTKFIFQPMERGNVVVDGERLGWVKEDGPLTAEIISSKLTLSWNAES